MVLLLGLVATGLLLAGYGSHGVGGGSGPRAGPGRTGEAVLPADAGAVLDLDGGEVRTVDPPPGTVVLTFDDGPDPTWTPQVLDVLERHGVPATFFVLGSRVAENPALTRRMHREGHEIGSHTYSHRDVTDLGDLELRLQLSLTQTALAGSAGITTSLFRPPYSSTVQAVTDEQRDQLVDIADDGYLVVLSDLDSRDWTRPGVDEIVDNATPAPGEGAIILLHDGGGDRSQTVEALDRLITRLEAQGVTFRTVSDVVAGSDTVGSRDAERPAPATTRLTSRSLVALQRLSAFATRILPWIGVAIGVLTMLRLVVTVVLARRHAREARARPLALDVAPPVTIVVPAYNEEAGIEAAVRSLAGSDHPEVEVIVVDDGSTDGTAAVVEGLDLPNVRLISQPNGGKPAALNTGIAAAGHDLVVTVDGDTRFEPLTLTYLVQPFVDPDVGAVSGNTKVVNRTGLLGRWQHLEYVMGFNLDRRTYEQLRCMPTVPGAIGAFRREALVEVGGVSDDTLAEDTDLTMAINRAGWKVVYEERARAWTEAPATVAALWRQRYRWSYGTMQAIWKHRRAVLDRESWAIGRLAIPSMVLFQVVFPVLAPLLDLWVLFGLVFLDPVPVLAAWVAFSAVQVALAAYAFRLDGESPRPLWAVPLQQLAYRQLMYLVVIQSTVTALMGVRLPWQPLERTGAINEDDGDPGGRPVRRRPASSRPGPTRPGPTRPGRPRVPSG
jgi:cellulose synthase/poly-beta-1,6-N-acetylglucosamine synthase-like glycosyltransferase/peptidoglycan/xylan/chitin deacetylase (PgdA/CDA1 family)